MKQVITKQGKTFDYSEILLFNRVDDKIVIMLNDKEQIEKFSLTGDIKEAPIAVIPYSKQELKDIVSSMKQIGGYTELGSNRIVVEYLDNIPTYNTRVAFDSSNKEIIENNLIEQRNAKERNVVGNWYDIEEKQETSTTITEEQRFKVLQIQKYEEQDNKLKTAIGIEFLNMSLAALASSLLFINAIDVNSFISFLPPVVLGVVSKLELVSMVFSICKYVNVNKDKERITVELQNIGINLEEFKGKGAK